jgi:hypothetical protein
LKHIPRLLLATTEQKMPKSMSDRAGDMLLGATFAASLGAVAFLLKLRKGNGKVCRRG